MLNGQCTDLTGRIVATAILEVQAPTTRQQRQIVEHRLEGLIERCRSLKPMLTAVVHPCSADALIGAIEAADAGLILPVLYGPEAEIRRIADHAHLNIAACRIVATEGPEELALKATMAAAAGEIAALMKGSLHTDVLLHAVMQKEAKLRYRTADQPLHDGVGADLCTPLRYQRRCAEHRTGHRSEARHLPECNRLCARVGHRSAESGRVGSGRNRADQNARHPRRGNPRPRWPIGDRSLVASSTGRSISMPRSTRRLRRLKHISSPVAGLADILIVPNIEAGNMVYKNLAFMADAQTAGLVVGARVPVILTVCARHRRRAPLLGRRCCAVR